MSVEDFDFVQLIDPINIDTFFSEYWEKKPLIISRKEKGYYSDLFSIKDLDHILYFAKPKPPELRVVKNQQDFLPNKYLKADGSLNLNQLYKAYYEDNTLIINGLHQFWKPLAIFSQNLQIFLNHRVIPNLYLSPKKSKGLSPHFDTHDVFVLQIEGSKEWKIHKPFQKVPLLGSFQPVIQEDNLPKVLHSITLEEGDLLYIPRGFIHHAETFDSFSLHITLGIYPSQWFDLIVNALSAIALKDSRFRKALPIGFLDRKETLTEIQEELQELTKILSEKASAQQAIELLSDQFIHQITPIPDGHFNHVNEVDSIDLETPVVKRQGMRCHLIHKGFSISIQFPGNIVNGPFSYQEAMQFVANTNNSEVFTAKDFPGSLNDEQKVNLIRRLVRGGLLKLA